MRPRPWQAMLIAAEQGRMDRQRGLLIRAAGPDWTQEFDTDAIRELAARPEFTSAFGDGDPVTSAEDVSQH